MSGLKLLLGVVAAGASPSAAAAPGEGPSTTIREPPEPLVSGLGAGGSSGSSGGSVGSGGTAIGAVGEGGGFGQSARGGRGGSGSGSEPQVLLGRQGRRRRRPGRDGSRAGGGEGGGTAGILSPAVVSRAKRLLVGVANIDESADVRRLAAQALSALGGAASGP